MGEFSEKVFAAVRHVPRGKVATYGQIARMIGAPRSARYVGYALRGNPEPSAGSAADTGMAGAATPTTTESDRGRGKQRRPLPSRRLQGRQPVRQLRVRRHGRAARPAGSRGRRVRGRRACGHGRVPLGRSSAEEAGLHGRARCARRRAHRARRPDSTGSASWARSTSPARRRVHHSPRATASATRSPSTAALMMPPAYPAPSPQGYSPLPEDFARALSEAPAAAPVPFLLQARNAGGRKRRRCPQRRIDRRRNRPIRGRGVCGCEGCFVPRQGARRSVCGEARFRDDRLEALVAQDADGT